MLLANVPQGLQKGPSRLPQGSRYLTLRDELETVYNAQDFTEIELNSAEWVTAPLSLTRPHYLVALLERRV